jgi:hypothetical protein
MSVVTVQKLKNRNAFPYRQVGRKVIFEKKAVLSALSPTYKFKKKGGNDECRK